MNELLNAANIASPIDINKVREAIDLAKKELVASIWRAANVSGLATTYAGTEAILENMIVTTTRDEVLFILNMRDAWMFLLGNLEYNNCWMLLREFNNIVGRGLIPNCGNLRRVNATRDDRKPLIIRESDVYEKVSELNKIVSPVEKALEYFCFLIKERMFVDGNKRVAQLMASKILIENGIGVLSIPVNELNDFNLLLKEFYQTEDSMRLKKFLLEKCISHV